MTDYEIGWNLYTDFCPIQYCQNPEQERGWWAALGADAVCETAGYLAQANDGDISDDYAAIRAGIRPVPLPLLDGWIASSPHTTGRSDDEHRTSTAR